MFKGLRKLLLGMAVSVFVLGFAEFSLAANLRAADPARQNSQQSNLAEQVRHQIAMLPYFGVFDNLSFTIDNSNAVVLSGQVVRPILKSDAETAVRRIEGVSKVENKIEVLPLSSFDDAIRLRTYWAIFSRPGFEKYAIQAFSPIRIIVKNGHVTLEGVVGSQFDKTVAALSARSVPGAFSVTDNLRIG
jgi:hyperosmotically inducible protein